MNRHINSIIVFALGLSAVACAKKETVDSTDVATHGMSLDCKVTDDGANVDIYAALHVGSYQSNTFARLTQGDTLVLRPPSGGPVTLVVTESGGKTAYGTRSSSPSSGDYILDFLRTKGASATNNKFTLPPPFTLVGPTGSVSRKSMVALTWDRASGAYATTLRVTGTCLETLQRSIVGDPGSYNLNSGDLRGFTSDDEAKTCTAQVTLMRTLETANTFSAEFGQASHGEGIQSRTISFQSAP